MHGIPGDVGVPTILGKFFETRGKATHEFPAFATVGGLKDTVQDYNKETRTGTGFLFQRYESSALLAAVDRGLAVFRDKQAWFALQRRGMGMDFSCDRSAKLYSDLYQQLVT